jgi:hypothetical protein
MQPQLNRGSQASEPVNMQDTLEQNQVILHDCEVVCKKKMQSVSSKGKSLASAKVS